uniref:carboxylating nicotinate-nucleotide diphosphorylase n=1 Tax=Pararhizobium sp. IMCC3301 TaxID=3067904 RepID=UPI00274046F9|nr:carboxylating nicotinate-nucleotide diphosphorylase [Pararhizobium sp. IMCC3301]
MSEQQTYKPELPRVMVDDAVRAALQEDLGRAGDITTLATIPPDAMADVVIASRQPGVIAGLPLARAAFRAINPQIRFETLIDDGDPVTPGAVVAQISGRARDVLSAERVALNYLGHLSGIATATAQFAAQIAHTKARVCCTRKTTPGLRAFEKYAVRCGGGSNHRFGLDDAVLIKDNHIAVVGSVAATIEAARAYVGHLVKIEVEVDTLEQLEEALSAKPDVVLLDNMNAAMLKKAVAMVLKMSPVTKTEASGGVKLDTIARIAEAGVDYISTGWITHSSPVLDLGLDAQIG